MNTNIENVINKIHADKAYLLKEIVEEKLIPGIKTYATLYNLVTKPIDSDEKIRDRDRLMGKKRVLRVDDDRLEVFVEKNPWNRIGKYRIYGKKIIEYLQKNF